MRRRVGLFLESRGLREKIKENDYNLNVTLYVFPEEETEEIDVEKEWRDIRVIEEDLAQVSKKIEGYLAELKGE